MAKQRPFRPDPITASAKPSRRRPMQLTASAKVSPLGSANSSTSSESKARVTSQAWQGEAWRYYDSVGELKYSAGFVGACLSRCILTIGVPDDDGKVGPAFDDKGQPITGEDDQPIPGLERAEEALTLIRALRSDVGGQSQMLRTMGIDLTVAGELHLVGTPLREPVVQQELSVANVSDLNWEVLSTDEFKATDKGYQRFRSPGATAEEIKGESVHAIRIYRTHPRYSDLADSTVMAVLDILEELVIMTREVRGGLLSRLASAGILLVPDEIDYGNSDNDGDAGEGDEDDPFTRDLLEAMGTAITDKGSAAGVVPLVVRCPADLIEKFRWMEITPNRSNDSSDKRIQAVQRLAQGLDLPVEIVTGHAGTTFANAVQIDDSLFKSHIEPVLEIICDALTVAFLRPALGQDSPLVVHYDATELVARPNRAQDGKDLHDRMAISDAALRGATGFADSDAPGDEEIQRRIRFKQEGSPLALSVMAKNGGSLPSGPSSPPPATPAGPADGAPLDQGGLTDGNNTDSTLTAAISVAAEVLVERAVQAAGARIRSKTNGKLSLQSVISQVPDAEVAVTLGPTVVGELMGNADLFARAFDPLKTWIMRRTGDHALAEQILQGCTRSAHQRLYAPRADFSPRELLAVAGDG